VGAAVGLKDDREAHKQTLKAYQMDVRFSPKSDIIRHDRACPLRAISGHSARRFRTSLCFNLIDNAVLQQSRNLFLMALVP